MSINVAKTDSRVCDCSLIVVFFGKKEVTGSMYEREVIFSMKPEYKNWVPKGMIQSFFGLTLFVCLLAWLLPIHWLAVLLWFLGSLLMLGSVWLLLLYWAFSYDGKRQLSKEIITGVASYAHVPAKGKALDVGCGSGALTIAVAERNPDASIVGIDRWGKEYASFSQALCERNAQIVGVANVSFREGNAIHLDYPDETFDMVTSNYVYHNIAGVNKQELLLETLRVLKKGGTFVIHDLMSMSRYGNMAVFRNRLLQMGYTEVVLLDTTDLWMKPWEAALYGLKGSTLLYGVK